MFVDETAATTSMARRFGHAAANICAAVFHMGIPKAITFVFGLRLRGVIAPKAYDHAMNAETFEDLRSSTISCPRLWRKSDIVVLDDVKRGSPKKPEVAEILAQEKLHGTIPAAIRPGLQPPSRW